MKLWQKFLMLFPKPAVIVPSVNRKERRSRQSIARRQPNIPTAENPNERIQEDG